MTFEWYMANPSQCFAVMTIYFMPADLARRMRSAVAAGMEVWAKWSGREPFYPLNLRHYVFNDWRVSNEKACLELGFQPTPLDVGLRETVAWYKAIGL